LLCCI